MGLKRIRQQWRLGRERHMWKLRAWRKARELTPVVDRTGEIGRDDILLFATLRNECARLPFFLKYYREMGIGHFVFVDNGSTDGSQEYLAQQSDCSVWRTDHSYKKAKFGIDWLNGLKARYAVNHWVLVVDIDEFFVYPYMDTRPLRALTEWLEASRRRSFGTLLIDMYARRAVADVTCAEGENPLDVLCWFDSGNYTFQRSGVYRNLWVQGGSRQRVFFPDRPEYAPALNKIPLVKWYDKAVYVSSTHTLLPRGLNQVYEQFGGEKASGALLHAKLLNDFARKAEEEVTRKQHYAASREYRVYTQKLESELRFWTPQSTRYRGWRQLDQLGLISTGAWA